MRRRATLLCTAAALWLAGSPAAAAPAAPGALEAKLGEMLMVGFRGTTLAADHPVLAAIRAGHVGGVVLFSRDLVTGSKRRNIDSRAQVRRLTATLQGAAPRPLLIAVDQEGGSVRRLGERFGFAADTSARHFGRQGDSEATARFARRVATTLAELGINVNLAPVVDLDVDPDSPAIGHHGRSYGADATTVVAHAAAFIRAHREAGVLTVLKHFPGHGSARSDSHHGLPDITPTWSRTELEPFRRLIVEALAGAVMPAHLHLAQLDPELPITLSPAALGGTLRGTLGFRGVVISDDMQMDAIRAHFPEEEALRRALLAGVDILVFANNSHHDPEIAQRALAYLASAVRRGDIPLASIDAALARIHTWKRQLRR